MLTARDFAPAWKPPNKGELGREHNRICAALSHLSRKRLAVKENWAPAEVVRLALEAFEDLVGDLGDAPHEGALRGYVAAVRTLYEKWLKQTPVPTVSFTTADTFTIPRSTRPPPDT
ncbi:MAG: hypothetical protein ACRDV9_09685 [Acidimicrobiia bacterium]